MHHASNSEGTGTVTAQLPGGTEANSAETSVMSVGATKSEVSEAKRTNGRCAYSRR